MYIAVKGGAAAIDASRALLAAARRGDTQLQELGVSQLAQQLPLLVGRVMAEGSLYDPELAALALKQALGDPIEAVFLLRAYRTTLPRLAYTEPLATRAMRVQRRVSAIFKDLPGGQLLGASFDYTQRLLDFDLLRAAAEPTAPREGELHDAPSSAASPLDVLSAEGLIEPAAPAPDDPPPPDITRDPPVYPLPRTARLQMLARADEGWVLGLGYSSQRGYANSHPFAGEVRHGRVHVELMPDELGFAIDIGEIELTECQMINQFVGSASVVPQFTRGYGLQFGHGERKAMAMSLVDRVLRADEFGERCTSAAQQQEFALPHGDNVEASGFVQHLKLPHYVTFESELQLIRALREAALGRSNDAAADVPAPDAETTA
jgi:alpha-D-ribose 1-methylphosphonate 5-triphosphate synthase subunit PhnI